MTGHKAVIDMRGGACGLTGKDRYNADASPALISQLSDAVMEQVVERRSPPLIASCRDRIREIELLVAECLWIDDFV